MPVYSRLIGIIFAAAAGLLAPTAAIASEHLNCGPAEAVPQPPARIELDGFSIMAPRGTWCGINQLYKSTVEFMQFPEGAPREAAGRPAHQVTIIATRVVGPAARNAEGVLAFVRTWLAGGPGIRWLMASTSRLEIDASRKAVSSDAAIDSAIGLDCVRFRYTIPSEEMRGRLCLDPGSASELILLASSESNYRGESATHLDSLNPQIEATLASIWLFEPSSDEAVAGFRAAADRGLAQAQFSLGFYYQLKKDYGEAIKWYRAAAAQNQNGAIHNVGVFYENGFGVDSDLGEAAKWYRRAAERGCDQSQYLLGMMLVEGRGVQRDVVEGLRFFKMAADQGLPIAQVNLGVSYERGYGVPKDLLRAYTWFKLAESRTSRGMAHDFASEAMKQLTSVLTGEQISAAEAGARSWTPGAE
jgi:TPR repeat protein